MARYILSITELAKLKHITTETLRYYDRIGLLKPDHTSESGHRYYSIRQYERLGTILELRKTGMTVKEIQDYFENRNFQKSFHILKKHQEKFEKNLKEQIKLNQVLLEKLDFLQSLSNLPEMEKVFEMEFPERYMITFGEKSGDAEEHAMAFTKLEDYIKEEIPILASDRVGVFANESLLVPSYQMTQAVPMILVSPDYADEAYLKKIPAGKYVCMYYKNGTLEKYDASFENVRNYIWDKGYEINGELLQLYKIDVTLTNDRTETVLEIQVPVK